MAGGGGRGNDMAQLNERYVTDREGNRVEVILPIDQYQQLLEALEELEDIRAYDEAAASGEEPVPFEQAVKEIERDGP